MTPEERHKAKAKRKRADRKAETAKRKAEAKARDARIKRRDDVYESQVFAWEEYREGQLPEPPPDAPEKDKILFLQMKAWEKYCHKYHVSDIGHFPPPPLRPEDERWNWDSRVKKPDGE